MTILEKIIINELKLSDKIINISPIDTIKILLYLIENKNFLRITTNVKKTELEHYILGIINNKYFFDYNAITNNYFNNIILDIFTAYKKIYLILHI